MKKKTKIVYIVEEINIRNIQPQVCLCDKQRCHGLFIPTRPNQTECLFAIREKELELEKQKYLNKLGIFVSNSV